MNKRRAVVICAVCGVAAGAISWAAEPKGTKTSGAKDIAAESTKETARASRAPGDLLASTGEKAEKKAMDVLDDMYRNEREGMLNAPPEDCRLIRILTQSIGAKQVVEIGTSNGYSGIWICLALRATGGKLTTFEIDPKRAAMARQNFARAGVEEYVTLVEGDAHKEAAKLTGPIDVLFIDADKTGYVDYLRKLLPLVRPGGLILAHNTRNCAKDLREYIKIVTTDPGLETVLLAENEQGMGITLKKSNKAEKQKSEK